LDPKRREVTGGWKSGITRGFILSTPHQGNKYNGDEIKKDEMGRACGIYGKERHEHRALWGNLKGKITLDLGVYEWATLKCILTSIRSVDQIHLAQERNK
jgi:hypothetical protein